MDGSCRVTTNVAHLLARLRTAARQRNTNLRTKRSSPRYRSRRRILTCRKGFVMPPMSCSGELPDYGGEKEENRRKGTFAGGEKQQKDSYLLNDFERC